MTLFWFVVWRVANPRGDPEPIALDPVNVWAGALLGVVALDLSRRHAPDLGRRRSAAAD